MKQRLEISLGLQAKVHIYMILNNIRKRDSCIVIMHMTFGCSGDGCDNFFIIIISFDRCKGLEIRSQCRSMKLMLG